MCFLSVHYVIHPIPEDLINNFWHFSCFCPTQAVEFTSSLANVNVWDFLKSCAKIYINNKLFVRHFSVSTFRSVTQSDAITRVENMLLGSHANLFGSSAFTHILIICSLVAVFQNCIQSVTLAFTWTLTISLFFFKQDVVLLFFFHTKTRIQSIQYHLIHIDLFKNKTFSKNRIKLATTTETNNKILYKCVPCR